MVAVVVTSLGGKQSALLLLRSPVVVRVVLAGRVGKSRRVLARSRRCSHFSGLPKWEASLQRAALL